MGVEKAALVVEQPAPRAFGQDRTVDGQQAKQVVPYLPRLTIDWVTTDPDRLSREIDGSVAFVDISGFTSLSEKLAKHGKIGAEELSHTIGRCFVDLLGTAYAYGGGLLKFGGDALLLFFSGDSHETRACRAAFEMRRALRELGSMVVLGHRVSLRMSVGVNSGLFTFFLVGDSHRELLVTGPAASTTVAMESAAEAGEILVSDATARALPAECVGEVKGEGHLLRGRPDVAASPAPTADAPEGRDLTSCIPRSIRDAVLSDHREPEHRRVTVAFVHFGGIDAIIDQSGSGAAAPLLDALLRGVQDIVDREGVTFVGSDIDRNGGKIILAAGMPSTSERDEHRMVLAACEILALETDLRLRIGVHRGAVFAGEIGPDYRRTLTVMGDTVNLAARLMAKASPGQVLTTRDVLDRVDAVVDATELQPFFVKGKAKPVRAFSVASVGTSREASADTRMPMVGRHLEIDLLRDAVKGVRQNDGRLVEIAGEPGIGKSRLVEELLHMTTDLTQLSASCEPYRIATPYYAFRRLFRDLLGLSPRDTHDDAVARIWDAVGDAVPHLLLWTPLLGALVDVEMDETVETRQLEDQFRRPKLADVATELLGALYPRPMLLTVEDAHWIDDASAEFLSHIASAVGGRPWLICVTRREVEGGYRAPEGSSLRLRLGPLDQSDAAKLLDLATQDAPVLPHQGSALVERSGGNPLFLRELVLTSKGAKSLAALPDSVEAVIAARIDQLPHASRDFIRRASVLGPSFSSDLLRAVLEFAPAADDEIWRELDGFLERDGRGNVRFAHALIRDSAYERLSFRLRRTLHAQVADMIRALADGQPEDQAELLSLHYLHAQRWREAWIFSLMAAERANALYANAESAELYERALEAGRQAADIERADLASVQEALGDAYNRAGCYSDAEASYRMARKTIEHDPVIQARLMLKLARVKGWLDRYADALRWITRGIRSIREEPGPEAAAQRAQLFAWYGRFCQEEGRHVRAIKWCQMAIDEAEASTEKDAMANALKVLDWARMDRGELEGTENWMRALALFEELGDLTEQAGVLNLLGIFAYFQGRWAESLEFYRNAQQMVRRTGNAVMDAFYMNNIGELILDQGRLEEAQRLFTDTARIWQAAGYRSGIASVSCNLARVAWGMGRHDEAMALFEDALQGSHGVGGKAEALEASARRAEFLVAAGLYEEALSQADDALETSRSLGGVSPQSPLLHRVRGIALLKLGDIATARTALEESLASARTRSADYEVALTLKIIARCDALDLAAHPDASAQSEAILDRLGVVWTADLLVPNPV